MAKNKQLAKHDQPLTAEEEAELMEGTTAADDSLGRDDIAIPRLTILQSNSPQTQKRDNTYVEGAEPGMIFDIVSGDMFDGEDGIVLLPVFYRQTFVEWITRDNGGGFVADHGLVEGEKLLQTTSRDDNNKDILSNGNQLTRTMEFIVHQLLHEGPQPCIVSMTSSQLTPAKKLNANIRKPFPNPKPHGKPIRAPFYGRAFRFCTVPQSNAKGSWFNWNPVFYCRFGELPSHYPWATAPGMVEYRDELENFSEMLKKDQVRFAPPPSNVEDTDPEAM